MKRVVESTTSEDAANVYEAIRIANPSGLGGVPELDVNRPDSIAKMKSENISLYDTFKMGSDHDTICLEWTSNFPITFDVAYPLLRKRLRLNDLNDAVIQTFLEVLSGYPDTFIARKVGMDRARKVSSMAKEVLQVGGVDTTTGRERLAKFDLKLREEGNVLNPGTTADIICAALALCVLGGYRP
jgi:triphosphoribosyl-dephospho-CoA synthase